MKTWDLIKRANHKLAKKEMNEAFNFYASYLDYENEQWKIPFLENLHQQLSDINAAVVFTSLNADMLMLTESGSKNGDKRCYVIYLLYFISGSIEEQENKDRFEQMLINMAEIKYILEDVLPSGKKVKVKNIVLSRDEDDLFFEDNAQHLPPRTFCYSSLEKFDLKEVLPANELDEVSDGFFEFGNSLSFYLQPDDYKRKIAKINADNTHIEDIAPKEYMDFITKLKLIFNTEKNITKVFDLSLNMAFINQNNIDGFTLASHFIKSVYANFEQDENVSLVHYRFNEIESFSAFQSFLENQDSNIVVIENLDKEIKAERLQMLDATKAELISHLCDYLENNNKNVFVLALEKSSWEQLVALNPLLRVCFQHIFPFKSYTEAHLLSYFQNELNNQAYSLNSEATDLAKEYFHFMKNQMDNGQYQPLLPIMLAREVRYQSLIRKSESGIVSDKVILKSDVFNSIKDEYAPENTRSLSNVMQDLNQLTGLSDVKQGIKEQAALVKINQLRKDDSAISLNIIFSGNPGTGKTTVASILGQVYKSIGVLSKGHVVSVKRHQIVDQFIGYTARNMKQFIDQARGGILFIDEAYALYKKDNERDFGQEAIDTLVAEIENIKDNTCIILAGYPDLMLKFLDSNPGLASRFPHRTNFNDYSAEELFEIFFNMTKSANYQLEDEAITIMKEFFISINENNNKQFGNARECRNLFEKLKLIQASRIIYSPLPEKTNLNIFETKDVHKLIDVYRKSLNKKSPRKKVGYV